MPSKENPAFASANNGIIKKATQGCNAFSSVRKGERPSAALSGMASANKTPPIVGWTPQRSKATHKKTPRAKYGHNERTDNTFNKYNANINAKEILNHRYDNPRE